MLIMDRSEEIIKKNLELRGFSDITFEPDGNIPPDFVINGKIAVEVRRLNQNTEFDGRMEGLEQSAYPLYRKIESLLKSLGPPTGDFSWFVLHHFSRPIPEWPELREWIRKRCLEVASIPAPQPGAQLEAKLNHNFDVVFLRSTDKHESLFLMGGSSDQDSGGFILSEMEKNMKHCIQEKSRKTSAHRERYSEWWLALVDHIGYGLSEDDQMQFKSFFDIDHDWDRILVVSPLDPARYFEL